MNRQITEAELLAVRQFEIDAAKTGLVVDDNADGRKNGELILSYLEQQNQTITANTLNRAVEMLRDKLIWKPQDQLDYENIFASLSSADQNSFLAWKPPARLVVSYGNSYRLLRFLKDRRMPVGDKNLQIAIANLGTTLEFTSVPSSVGETGYGRHSKSSRSFAPKSETNRTLTDSLKDHSKDPAYAPTRNETSVSADEKRWRHMAEGLRANLHSKTAQVRQIMRPTWRETYEARRRFLDGRS
jgi:hypothetical protein